MCLNPDLSDIKTITDSKSAVETYVGRHGLNLIINNGGIASRSKITDVTPEEMTNMFNVNAVGPLMVIKVIHISVTGSCIRVDIPKKNKKN